MANTIPSGLLIKGNYSEIISCSVRDRERWVNIFASFLIKVKCMSMCPKLNQRPISYPNLCPHIWKESNSLTVFWCKKFELTPEMCFMPLLSQNRDYRLHHIPATCLRFSKENDKLEHKVKREWYNPEILSLFLHMLTLWPHPQDGMIKNIIIILIILIIIKRYQKVFFFKFYHSMNSKAGRSSKWLTFKRR